jgi:hypothetical protein
MYRSEVLNYNGWRRRATCKNCYTLPSTYLILLCLLTLIFELLRVLLDTANYGVYSSTAWKVRARLCTVITRMRKDIDVHFKLELCQNLLRELREILTVRKFESLDRDIDPVCPNTKHSNATAVDLISWTLVTGTERRFWWIDSLIDWFVGYLNAYWYGC